MSLENNPLYNAGRGAAFDIEGAHALDASIMAGHTRACGAVIGVSNLKNPIRCARLVMEKSPHVLLAGSGAEQFSAAQGAEVVARNYFSTQRKFNVLCDVLAERGLPPLEAPKHGWPDSDTQGSEHGVCGTVGCVALDSRGHLAAATSTGGLSGKMIGRVGDSPIPAAGTYANERVAVSGTGQGEEYLRHFIAARVAMLVELGGLSVDEAVEHCLTKVLAAGDGGLIAIDRDGRVSIRTTTGGLPSAAADSEGQRVVQLWPESR